MNTLPRDDNRVPLQNTYKTIGTGRKTVTTAGTAVALVASSTECKRLEIQALYSNTGNISVGDSNTLAGTGSERGIILLPGGSYTVGITDVASIYIDSSVNGEGVSFTYFN